MDSPRGQGSAAARVANLLRRARAVVMLPGHISTQIDDRSPGTCICARGSNSLAHGLSPSSAAIT
jgi:hypothetical protein